MAYFYKLLKFLDIKTFLGYRLWEFSWLNTNRYFFYYFLGNMLLRYPYKGFHGLRTYQKLIRTAKHLPLHGTVSFNELINKINLSQYSKSRFIIAPGFCMKPYDVVKNKSTCPAGHANHNCLIFEKFDYFQKDQSSWSFPCNICSIGQLARISVQLKSDFYIMTSALDIARDLFLPALRCKLEVLGLFFLCAYSTEPFSFGLAVSGIKGALINFCQGDCSDHRQWTLADMGIKNEQTRVKDEWFMSLIEELSSLQVKQNSLKAKSFKYVKKKHIYSYQEC